MGRVVGLGCHEGYPGHHVLNMLLEQHLARGRGWIEFMLYPLYSPQSFIAEGSANYGVELAFPGNERLEFERRVLYPLAGLSSEGAETYLELQNAIEELSGARFTIARDLLEGRITPRAGDRADPALRPADAQPRRADHRLHRALSRLCDQLRPRPGDGESLYRARRAEPRGALGGDAAPALRAEPAGRPQRHALMRAFFDARQRDHAPALELHNGAFVPFAESPARADAILAALGGAEPAVDHGEAPLRAVHSEDYLAFLWSAHKDWRSAGREGDAIGYAWPVVRRRPLGARPDRRPLRPVQLRRLRARSRPAPGTAPIGARNRR